MPQTIKITLTTAGPDAGPFDLYSCTGLTCDLTPFDTGILRSSIITGYTSTIVPNGSNMIRVVSVGPCHRTVDLYQP